MLTALLLMAADLQGELPTENHPPEFYATERAAEEMMSEPNVVYAGLSDIDGIEWEVGINLRWAPVDELLGYFCGILDKNGLVRPETDLRIYQATNWNDDVVDNGMGLGLINCYAGERR